jgi:hypothetical protein
VADGREVVTGPPTRPLLPRRKLHEATLARLEGTSDVDWGYGAGIATLAAGLGTSVAFCRGNEAGFLRERTGAGFCHGERGTRVQRPISATLAVATPGPRPRRAGERCGR